MKASVYTMYGPPDVIRIQEVEKPVPRAHEVLIRTIATTVNRSDTGIRSGKPFFVRFFFGLVRPKRTVLGSEFAGEVEAVGEAVKTFEVGDRVFGLTGDKFGADAEYISLPEDAAILAKPTNMDFEEAAAVCDGPMLAWNYLGKVDVRAGTSILIYGASGSIGTAGIQLARALGAEVTAVCGTKSVELARSLGANLVIDYMEKDFTAHGKVYDFVFDAVGKTTFFRCRKLLKKGGVYFATDLGFLAHNPLLVLATKIIGSRKAIFPIPKEKKEDVAFFKELCETGKYRPVIDRRYQFDEIVEAHKYVDTGQKTGNVVVRVAPKQEPTDFGEGKQRAG